MDIILAQAMEQIKDILADMGSKWAAAVQFMYNNKGAVCLGALSETLLEESKEEILKVLQTGLEASNKKLRNSKRVRKELGLQLKQKDRPRSVYLPVGQLNCKRDYYLDKRAGNYVYPLDIAFGMEKYVRVDATVRAELLNAAAEESYSRSAQEVTGGQISKQSVHNYLLTCKVPVKEPQEKGKVVKDLYIYADEDHAHVRAGGTGQKTKSQIVPLVAVTEGTETVSKDRSRTQGTMYFTSPEFRGTDVWESVSGYICNAYDVTKLEHVYVYGDGGSWIQRGLDEFPQTVHVMDGYHFQKALHHLANVFPKRNVTQALRFRIEKGDREGVQQYLQSLLEGADEKQTRDVNAFAIYINRNFEAIRNELTLEIPGSCTEAQVSHVLSERCSRDPIAWSEKGLGQMGRLRVLKWNNGKVQASDFNPDCEVFDYKELLRSEMEEKIDVTFFDKKNFNFDGNSATQRWIRSLGACRNNLTS